MRRSLKLLACLLAFAYGFLTPGWYGEGDVAADTIHCAPKED